METGMNDLAMRDISNRIISDNPMLFSGVENNDDEKKLRLSKELHRAGYYRFSDNQWKQITPDLRNKIAVRPAYKQPDGKYVIDDVSVFCPIEYEGKKGEILKYDEEDVLRAIKNTNDIIEKGGQAPPITIGHIKDVNILLNDKGCGKAVNWRSGVFQGRKFSFITIVDLDPEIYGDWREGRYTGISAGLTGKHGDKDIRFHHVAILGNKVQLISDLPRIELFEAVCFSLEVPTMEVEKKPEEKKPENEKKPITEGIKDDGKGASNDDEISELISSAHAAHVIGDHESCKNILSRLHEMYQGSGNGSTGDLGNMGGGDRGEKAVPAAGDLYKSVGGVSGPQPSDTLSQNFSAQMSSAFSQFQAQIENQNKIISEQKALIQSAILEKQNLGKAQKAEQEFSAHCNTLQALGHTFDRKANEELFQTIAGDERAVNKLKEMLNKTPINSARAIGGPTFANNGSTSIFPTKQDKDLHKDDITKIGNDLLSKHAPHMGHKLDEKASKFFADSIR